MATAGQVATAGRIPGERIATEEVTSDSSPFTTLTTLMSVTAPLVAGRVYKVRAVVHIGSDTSGDDVLCEIRRDDSGGTQIQRSRLLVQSTSSFGWPLEMEGEHLATATGNQTFVFTAVLSGGSGDLRLRAAPSRPAYLYVDYIRG